MQKVKGIVFDVDGLLVDTEDYQWKGWVEVLKPFGLTITREEYFQYAGKTGSIIEDEFVRKHGLKIKRGSLVAEKEKLLIDWFESENLRPMTYAVEAVQILAGLPDVKFAVASGSPEYEIKLKLRKAGLSKFFSIYASIDDVKRGKPFPDIYLEAVRKIGLKPEECLSFEDTQYGLWAAKSAGLICLAVPSEFCLKQDFSKADGVFPNLKEATEYAKIKYF